MSWQSDHGFDVPLLEDAPDLEDQDDPFPAIETSPVFWIPGRSVFHSDRACKVLSRSSFRLQSAGGTLFLPADDVDWAPCPHCIGVVGGGDSA